MDGGQRARLTVRPAEEPAWPPSVVAAPEESGGERARPDSAPLGPLRYGRVRAGGRAEREEDRADERLKKVGQIR